jgi:hypothetical protein
VIQISILRCRILGADTILGLNNQCALRLSVILPTTINQRHAIAHKLECPCSNRTNMLRKRQRPGVGVDGPRLSAVAEKKLRDGRSAQVLILSAWQIRMKNRQVSASKMRYAVFEQIMILRRAKAHFNWERYLGWPGRGTSAQAAQRRITRALPSGAIIVVDSRSRPNMFSRLHFCSAVTEKITVDESINGRLIRRSLKWTFSLCIHDIFVNTAVAYILKKLFTNLRTETD